MRLVRCCEETSVSSVSVGFTKVFCSAASADIPIDYLQSSVAIQLV
jgi:hypothetical protein